MYLYGKMAVLRLSQVIILYFVKLKYIPVIEFLNILNICILNQNTWIAIIKYEGLHASKFGIIYSKGGHFGF